MRNEGITHCADRTFCWPMLIHHVDCVATTRINLSPEETFFVSGWAISNLRPDTSPRNDQINLVYKQSFMSDSANTIAEPCIFV